MGALSGGSEAPGVVKGDAFTRRGINTIESNDSAVRAATALYHRLCTWPLRGIGF